MIKLTYVLRRRPEMTRDEFQDYWRNQHAPLVESVRDDLRIQRYIQVHTFADAGANDANPRGRMQDAHDGVAELWWDSVDDLRAAQETAAGRRAAQLLYEDEAKFIDFTRSSSAFANEHVIIDGP
jgi:uncharacterized protein (TIGR02118 family)